MSKKCKVDHGLDDVGRAAKTPSAPKTVSPHVDFNRPESAYRPYRFLSSPTPDFLR